MFLSLGGRRTTSDTPPDRLHYRRVRLFARSLALTRGVLGLGMDFPGVQIVREDPRFQAAVRRRGFEPEQVCVDPWCVGYFGPEDGPVSRIRRQACGSVGHGRLLPGKPLTFSSPDPPAVPDQPQHAFPPARPSPGG